MSAPHEIDAARQFEGERLTLGSSSEDGSVRFWNVATRREVARFEGQDIMDQVTFAPDGNVLLLTSRPSAAKPATTVFWRAPTLPQPEVTTAANPRS